MIADIEMLRQFYAAYTGKVQQARQVLCRPMTYAEKVLFAHLYDAQQAKPYKRGVEYVNFRPKWRCSSL